MNTMATTAPAMKTCHCAVTPGTSFPNTVISAAPPLSSSTATPTATAASATISPKKIMRRVSSPTGPTGPERAGIPGDGPHYRTIRLGMAA
ncbi:hypothetical protein [Actinomadura madurae]|uniref:hypothetical protein n=1 Tax=Actinomadura madurae TaxID=1993 RepID=UPI0020D21A44|nr:hypothetical protein [Actinomadura madurae]MCP9981618.1 hypothetical protein [Actinomadura madurae]MCQ0006876.1 hypothetical protein [Actinomadura madurae]